MDGPVPLTVELVRALLVEQFPRWADLPVTPVANQGNDNRTFRLGDQLPAGPAYAAAVAKEAGALSLLARHVAVPLPEVEALGRAGAGYPHPWSVRRWLAGDVLADAGPVDQVGLGADLGGFPVQLRAAPAHTGPACGQHSFHRGCHPSVYADQVQDALARLDGLDDAGRVAFRSIVDLDADTWARARGWALWKALVTRLDPDSPLRAQQELALARLLRDG